MWATQVDYDAVRDNMRFATCHLPGDVYWGKEDTGLFAMQCEAIGS